MGLSRNKVAVPEGAAGTPPFWSDALTDKEVGSLSHATIRTSWTTSNCLFKHINEKEEAEPQGEVELDSPIAQLVRALH